MHARDPELPTEVMGPVGPAGTNPQMPIEPKPSTDGRHRLTDKDRADLIAWRHRYGLNQRQLADALGESWAYVSAIEHGSRKHIDIPHVLRMKQLATDIQAGTWAPPPRKAPAWPSDDDIRTFCATIRSRRDLELHLGMTYDQVLRLLRDLLRRGVVQKVSNGHATRYVVRDGTPAPVPSLGAQLALRVQRVTLAAQPVPTPADNSLQCHEADIRRLLTGKKQTTLVEVLQAIGVPYDPSHVRSLRTTMARLGWERPDTPGRKHWTNPAYVPPPKKVRKLVEIAADERRILDLLNEGGIWTRSRLASKLGLTVPACAVSIKHLLAAKKIEEIPGTPAVYILRKGLNR